MDLVDRNRLVRCIILSNNSRSCTQCSWRGHRFVPKDVVIREVGSGPHGTGSGQLALPEDNPASAERAREFEFAEQYPRYAIELECLRNRVDAFPSSTSILRYQRGHYQLHQSNRQSANDGLENSGPMHSDCAPLLKLFGNQVIGHTVTVVL